MLLSAESFLQAIDNMRNQSYLIKKVHRITHCLTNTNQNNNKESLQLTKSVYQKTKDNLDWLAFEEKETLSPDGEIKIKLTLDFEGGLCLKI